MYQIPPSSAGATSWGRDPGGSENACREVSEDDSVGEVFCEVGSEVDILGSLAIEGRVADGGETGSFGVIEAPHPINTRTVEIPRNDEDNPLLILGQVGLVLNKVADILGQEHVLVWDDFPVGDLPPTVHLTKNVLSAAYVTTSP